MGDHLRGEEVYGRDGASVSLDEIRPCGVLPTLWSRRNPVAFRDVANRLVADRIAQADRGSLDTAIAPLGILLGKAGSLPLRWTLCNTGRDGSTTAFGWVARDQKR